MRFLSPEWMEAVNRAAASCPEVEATAGQAPVTISQLVTGGPDGDVAYTLRVGDGGMRVSTGGTDDATVTISEDWTTAVAVARGEMGADEAVMAGRMAVRGDMEALIAARDLLQIAQSCVAAVGPRTSY